MRRSVLYVYICASAIILAGALSTIQLLASKFGPDTTTVDHPTLLLCSLLVIAGIAWFALLPLLRRYQFSSPLLLASFILLGLTLRLMFFGSQPIYENDYKRYLWDGAVTATGANPYIYSPSEIFEASKAGARSVPDLARLAVMSNEADFITGEINSPVLTTIYPPAAQGIFAIAHWIAPYKPWGLKLVFLVIELLGLFALLAGLRARGFPIILSGLYWLNPMIIFTTYNGVHMDVLLVAPLLAAVLYVGRHPIRAAVMLSLAAAVKIWPLLLAPVLFRKWRHQPILYLGIAALVAVLTLFSLMPMLITLNKNAGLAAYSVSWTNSSFLFPGLRDLFSLTTETPDKIARYTIAAILTGLSLWLGFAKTPEEKSIPAHLMLLSAAFVFLSPTGYPWYFIWFLMFLPLAEKHWSARGLALLTVGAAAYFSRFKLGEAGHYDVYSKVLLPLEFGIPLLLLSWDGWKARTHD